MYAIQNRDGLYLAEDGKYINGSEIHKIKWFKWYLQAEESTCGTSDNVIGAMTMLESIIADKDKEISELKILLDKETQAHSFAQDLYVVKKKQYDLMKDELERSIKQRFHDDSRQ